MIIDSAINHPVCILHMYETRQVLLLLFCCWSEQTANETCWLEAIKMNERSSCIFAFWLYAIYREHEVEIGCFYYMYLLNRIKQSQVRCKSNRKLLIHIEWHSYVTDSRCVEFVSWMCCVMTFIIWNCNFTDQNRESKYWCYRRNCNSYCKKILFTFSKKNMYE